ncbi:MAG: hypothetical protein AAF587_19445 [Bacteroidota bacterium]
MKNVIFSLLLISALPLCGQNEASGNQLDFELGKGLNILLNDGSYQFTLSGMIQPSMAYEKVQDREYDLFFNAKRAYLNFSGFAAKEKVSFFLQTDFSLTEPLLDAWLTYHPWKQLSISLGQKQTIGNNREMMIMEDQLQFPERGLLSQTFSRSGREFGAFIDSRLGSEQFGIVPQIALTSGDGRNSFGTDSRDVDLGGIKYAARLDVYPLGFFSEDNESSIADLGHESSPKLLVGMAASYNDGASHPAGAGHGDFFLYNLIGDVQLPDYRQLYSDILFKFQGFSLLGEYVVATATSLQGSYVDEAGGDPLLPTEISQFLRLGRAMNVQVGYASKGGWALDARYSMLRPEFADNSQSLIQEQNEATLGLSKYWGNGLKIQVAASSYSSPEEVNRLLAELLLQLVF